MHNTARTYGVVLLPGRFNQQVMLDHNECVFSWKEK